MFNKPVRVMFADRVKEAIEKLKEIVAEESRSGTTQSSNQILLRAIRKKIELLGANPYYGMHVPQDRIPDEYRLLYDAANLWKINLSGAWRILYTIKGGEIEILALIMDLLSHKSYENKFGYASS